VTHGQVRIGDVDVTVVCEGYAPFDLADELPQEPVDWVAERERHPWAFHDGRSWAWHVHAFVIRTPEGIALVDTGVGGFPAYRPWALHRAPEQALAAAGVAPEDVSVVIHTHLHADHAGGAVLDGRPRFPNAVYHVHLADWSFFAAPEHRDDYTARDAMSELERRGMVDLTEDDREVLPGLRVLHAPGHTPGHRAVILERGGGTLLLAGDLLHVPVQITLPASPSNHDVDPGEGADSRARLVGAARSQGWSVAVSHFARPFGRVEDGGWRSFD
jgi:glyoxylase-like metal-dependent hydrolase (beta-lactamase superfamily II)